MDHHVQVEPRNLTWLHLPLDLAYLSITDPRSGNYCLITAPSADLARAALIEAVFTYAQRWHGDVNAPPLEIRAHTK